MIFHPLVWRGIPLRVIPGEPLGLIGWQGIVPAKAGVMAERMVDMVTTQLVDVQEVRRFGNSVVLSIAASPGQPTFCYLGFSCYYSCQYVGTV